MKVAILGGTGMVGSRLARELANRGHEVTGISRHPEKQEKLAGVSAAQGDVHDRAALARLIAGHDVVVHSLRFADTDTAAVIAVAKSAGARLLVVGGAGSLEVAPGVQLVDTPAFPAEYKAEALAGREFLNTLRSEHGMEWAYLSPSAILAPGPRTGRFRLGTDQLLTGADGQSWISAEDFASALVDELEAPKHRRERFTVGY